MNGWWLLRDGEEAGGERTGPRLGDLGPQVGGGALKYGASSLSMSLPTPVPQFFHVQKRTNQLALLWVDTVSLIFSSHINKLGTDRQKWSFVNYVDFNTTLRWSSLLVDIRPGSTQLHCGCASLFLKRMRRSWALVSGKESQGAAHFLPGCALQAAGGFLHLGPRIPARVSVGAPGRSQHWVPEAQTVSLQVCQGPMSSWILVLQVSPLK